eukprot:5511660-Amphidinium_carterae.1
MAFEPHRLQKTYHERALNEVSFSAVSYNEGEIFDISANCKSTLGCWARRSVVVSTHVLPCLLLM